MVRNSKQTWEVGQAVKVGFLKLRVLACIPTPGDGAPDAYVLSNLAGDRVYEFVPHLGLHLTTPVEAKARIEAARSHAERIAAEGIARAAKASQARSAINSLFAEVAA